MKARLPDLNSGGRRRARAIIFTYFHLLRALWIKGIRQIAPRKHIPPRIITSNTALISVPITQGVKCAAPAGDGIDLCRCRVRRRSGCLPDPVYPHAGHHAGPLRRVLSQSLPPRFHHDYPSIPAQSAWQNLVREDLLPNTPELDIAPASAVIKFFVVERHPFALPHGRPQARRDAVPFGNIAKSFPAIESHSASGRASGLCAGIDRCMSSQRA